MPTTTNDSDSIKMRLSVKEIVKLHTLIKDFDENESVTIEQTNTSGIGRTTKVFVDLTHYECW